MCKGYKGAKPLKMYPTWEPSNHGEKQRIVVKYRKASSPNAARSQSPSAFPPPLDLGGASGSALVPVPELAAVPAEQGTGSRKRKLPTRTAAPPVAGRTRTPSVEVLPSSPPRKAYNLAVKAAPKVPKSPTCSRQRTKTNKPARRTIIVSSEEELTSGNSRSESDSSSADGTPDSQQSGDKDFRVVKHDRLQATPASAEQGQPPVAEKGQTPVAELRQPPVAEKGQPPVAELRQTPVAERGQPPVAELRQPEAEAYNYIGALTAHEGIVIHSPHIANMQHPIDVHEIVLESESPPEEQPNVHPAPLQHKPLTREECEKKTYEEATEIYSVQNQVGPPPEPKPVNGLYILILQTEEPWVPKHLLEDPDGCMQFLKKQLDDGTIGARMWSAFGQWYLYGRAKVQFCSYVVLQCYRVLHDLVVGLLLCSYSV